MQRILLIISICALQISSLTLPNTSFAVEERWEDPSCQAVVLAFKRTPSYPNYSLERRLIRADGSERPFTQSIFTPSGVQEKRSFEKVWRSSARVYPADGPYWDRYKPTFTDYKLVASETNSSEPIDHYLARWAEFPYRANMDVWIARNTKLLIRHVRTFLDDRWEFPEQRIATAFSYEGLEATTPQKLVAATEVNTSCEQVKQMLDRFNSADRIQADIQEIYMAKNEPSRSSVVISGGKQYTREGVRPWYVASRQLTSPKEISSCAFYGDQNLNGIPTTVYGYQRLGLASGGQRILSWVSKDTGLPIKEYFITVNPDNGKERLISYSYDPELKTPE